MAMQRANPLPVGRYWVDVFEKDQPSFRGWLGEHFSSVVVEKQENFLRDTPRTWYLFSVSNPVPWEGPGYPTIADDGVKVAADTADRPPPPKGVVEQAGEVIDEAESAAKTAGVVAGLLVGGLILWRLFS